MTPVLQRALDWPSNPFGENICARVPTRLSCSFFFFFVGKISCRQVLVKSAWWRTETISEVMYEIYSCWYSEMLFLNSFPRSWSEQKTVVWKIPMWNEWVVPLHFSVNIVNKVTAFSSSWIILKQSPQVSKVTGYLEFSGVLAIVLLGVVQALLASNILSLLYCHFRWSTFTKDVNLYIY